MDIFSDNFVNKDLPPKDVPLKYEKSGGTVWVSLDQFKSHPEKLSSPSKTSPKKTPSKPEEISTSQPQNSQDYTANQENPSSLSFQGNTS